MQCDIRTFCKAGAKQGVSIKNKFNARAEITVFLTLLFGIMSALTLTVIESARNQVTRIQVERVMQTAIHSCFSEYNQDLLSCYDILAIDSSYRMSEGSVTNVREHLRDYAEENLKSDYPEREGNEWLRLSVNETELHQYELLSDNGGEPLLNQICDYMMSGEGENGGLLPSRSELQSIKNFMSIRSDGEFMSCFSDALSKSGALDNPAEEIFGVAVSGNILDLVMRGEYDYKTFPTDCPSKRSLKRGTARDTQPGTHRRNREWEKGTLQGGDEEYILQAYLMEKFSNCVNPKGHSYMAGETEYLIMGKLSEDDSIEECARWILAEREMNNLESLEENEEVLIETEELANQLCFDGTGNVYYTQLSLIYAWTYVESVLEVSRLYHGGAVDISRGKSNPEISLSDILEFREHLGEGGGTGMNYSKILSGMLMYVDSRTKLSRSMDVIEMNMNYLGHEGFRVDGCVTFFKAKMTVTSEYGHDCEIEREYGYY